MALGTFVVILATRYISSVNESDVGKIDFFMWVCGTSGTLTNWQISKERKNQNSDQFRTMHL